MPSRPRGGSEAGVDDRPTLPAPPEERSATISMQAPAPRASRAHAGGVVDDYHSFAFRCSPHALFEYLGPGFEQHTGIPAHEQVGRGLAELLHPDDVERADTAVRSSLRLQARLELDVRIRRYDGAFCWFRARGRLQRTAAGPRLCGTLTDVDDLYRAKRDALAFSQTLAARLNERLAQQAKLRDALERDNQRLLRLQRALETFAVTAAHDLKEPLRTLTNCSELLRQRYVDRIDSAGHGLFGAITDAAERMRLMVHDVLELARVSYEPAAFIQIDSAHVVADVLRHLDVAVHRAAASVVSRDLPTVWAQRRELTSLFENLIANALKYRGVAAPLIEISAQTREHELCFSVRDNGPGVPAPDRERIFEPFVRLHGHAQSPGSGLGLTLCRSIVERHGGRIWVEAAPEGGAIFRFTLSIHPQKSETPPAGGSPAGGAHMREVLKQT